MSKHKGVYQEQLLQMEHPPFGPATPSEVSNAGHRHTIVGLAGKWYDANRCPACHPVTYARYHSRHNSLNYKD